MCKCSPTILTGVDAVRCESLVGPCTYRYFVAVDESDMIDPNANQFLDVHVEFLRCKCTWKCGGILGL